MIWVESIQNFIWDLYWQGRLLTPLKHRGFSTLPLHQPHVLLLDLLNELCKILILHTIHLLDERILLEAVGKINQTHQRFKYLSFHTWRGSWANGSAPNLLSCPFLARNSLKNNIISIFPPI